MKTKKKKRKIVSPSKSKRREIARVMPWLQRVAAIACDPAIVHGFAPLRSPVTMAMAHRGYRFTLCADIEDAFGSTTPMMFFDALHRLGRRIASVPMPDVLLDSVLFLGGVLPQGYPSSPDAFNIVMSRIDLELDRLAPVYGRYADDLAWSADDRETLERALVRAREILAQHGYRLAARKIRIMDGRYQRRIICGVSVADDIRPTRRARRAARAAAHRARIGVPSPQHRPHRQWRRYRDTCRRRGVSPVSYRLWVREWLASRARGLAEWCRLRPPECGRRSAARAVGQDIGGALRWLFERAAKLPESRQT